MELEFFGAAGEVTGSCHIVRINNHQILLDCGMIQGSRKDEARNRDPFPFDPAQIDAVILSHAHIDHSGRLPLLVKRGFNGPIYTQNATKDLCPILLEDSARLGENDTKYENRRRARKGLDPLEPLYTHEDARDALANLVGMPYREKREVLPGVSVCFQDAGHIIGSAIVEVWLEENGNRKKIVFSGDLGQRDAPILHDPALIGEADLVLMESTYGNRTHRDQQHTVDEIGEVIREARHDRGNVLIPAFAIGRSQNILYMFGTHYDEWDLGRWHVFLDSPMAIKASKVYWDYPHLYDDEATKLRKNHHEMPGLANLHLTQSAEESMVINRIKSGAIVLAGSGMCNGGRIVHHLKHNVWRKECHVLIVGFQAYGSTGRRLVDGEKFIKIHGETIRVAARIHTVGGLSAHGDRGDLAHWVAGFTKKPPIYLVHGETKSATALQDLLQSKLGLQVGIAKSGERISL